MSSSRDERRQQPTPKGAYQREEAVQPRGTVGGPSAPPARDRAESHGTNDVVLLEKVLERENLRQALKRIEQKPKAAPGADGMTVRELRPYLAQHWERIRAEILAGTYEPQPVRRAEIPKPNGGGKRALGIPRVLDRFLQQALLQVLTPIFDPYFSPHSYAFRRGKNGHQAVRAAQGYIQAGYTFVVDLDLEKFFDRVNHDKLMARVARRVKDKRVLKLIRKYLESGVMINGVVRESEEGTPQGGPLSPLLSNIMLDDLDKELEKRGHQFVRYADDCNIYVRSRRAGERVMKSVRGFLEGDLSLRVNEAKSAVDYPQRRKFLGFSFFRRKGEVKIRLAPQSVQRVKENIREFTNRTRALAMAERIRLLNQKLRGWVTYFALAEVTTIWQELDGWMRRRLRMCLWKQWKRVRTRFRELQAHGLRRKAAWMIANTRKGHWCIAETPQLHQALGNAYWRAQGLISLKESYDVARNTMRTA